MSLNHLNRLLAAACCVLAQSALATDPAEGTLSESTPTLSVSGGPYVVSNPAADCTAGYPTCDIFALTVDLPSGYAAAHPDMRVQIDLIPDSSTADFDLQVNDAAGNSVGSSGNAAGQPEQVTFQPSDGQNQYSVDIVPFTVAGDSLTMTIALVSVAASASEDPCAASGSANGGTAVLGAGVADDLARLASGAQYSAFIHFGTGTHKAQDALLTQLGLSIGGDFRQYANSVFVTGPVSAFKTLAHTPSVSYIEPNKKLHFTSDTATWASRIRTVQEPSAGGPYYAADGSIIEGKGVTVAVVDSGTDVTHPDFAGRITGNYKVIGNDALTAQVIDIGPDASSDTTGGHGTHCSGIALGAGTASTGDYPDPSVAPNIQGTYSGAAPQANLLAYGTGEAIAVFTSATAFQHILDNYDSFTPRVRVISNSYGDGAGSSYNPGDTQSCLTKALVAKGVSVVFAAGNDGGDGSADNTSSYCKDPTPGVICVASYDDAGTGDTEHALSSFSSRGKQGDPANYPDIAAPGDLITATCTQPAPGQSVCATGAETKWQPYYGTISGTSMATPQVAGSLALVYQAKPDLSPAQAEKLLQDTARKVGTEYEADPQNPGSTINYGYGAGLMNVQAALDALSIDHAGLPAPGVETTIFDGDDDSGQVIDGASDAIKLTMQETAAGATPAGVTYRLTVRDAADFSVASQVIYKVMNNVAGKHFETSIVATPDDVTIPEAGSGNNAVASSVSRDGNVISFFVAYDQMGYPAQDEPIHNIRVEVDDDVTGEVDLAPSPSNTPVAVADSQPMFGRATTVLQSVPKPPSNESSCTLPGITMLTSPAGLTGNGLPTGQDDLRQAWIAEPAGMPGKLVFTIKVDNLSSVPPGYRWVMYFSVPGDDNQYFVAMDTSNGDTEYNYGTWGAVDAPEASVGVGSVIGTLDDTSSYDADGTIQLVLDKAAFENETETALPTGTPLKGVAASVRQSSSSVGTASGLTVDSAAAAGPYLLTGNVCGSAGGGGAFGWLTILPLLGFSALRRRSRR